MIEKISTILSVFSIYLFVAIPSYAATTINPCPRDAGGDFNKLCGLKTANLADVIRNGITILFIVATIAALFFLVFGGIRWITSSGDKAKLEESRNILVAAAVGLVITFLSYFILSFILELFGLPSVGNFTIPNLI